MSQVFDPLISKDNVKFTILAKGEGNFKIVTSIKRI